MIYADIYQQNYDFIIFPLTIEICTYFVQPANFGEFSKVLNERNDSYLSEWEGFDLSQPRLFRNMILLERLGWIRVYPPEPSLWSLFIVLMYSAHRVEMTRNKSVWYGSKISWVCLQLISLSLSSQNSLSGLVLISWI